ncbi:MAG: FAD binding domain-containing protein [Gemmatimonadales bacterium]
MADLPVLSYCRPRNLPEAISALSRRGARAYAGGTDLVVALTDRRPSVGSVRELVDIKHLAVAKGIVDRGTTVRIGALTTAAELAASGIVRRDARALAEAAEQSAAPALRRRGTIGGNLVTPHPAGDLTIALMSLGATVEVADRTGRRRVPVATFIGSPIHRSRLVLAVYLPKCRHSAFEKLGRRQGFSRSVLAVAVSFSSRAVGVAIGGVARRPVVATRTSAALRAGTGLTEALAADRLGSADLRLLAVMTRRAHHRAGGR